MAGPMRKDASLLLSRKSAEPASNDPDEDVRTLYTTDFSLIHLFSLADPNLWRATKAHNESLQANASTKPT